MFINIYNNYVDKVTMYFYFPQKVRADKIKIDLLASYLF